MAHTRSNKRPDRSGKQKVRPFIGKCSKCGAKGVEVVKVKSAQMCSPCLMAGAGKNPGVNVMEMLKDALKTPTVAELGQEISDAAAKVDQDIRDIHHLDSPLPQLPPIG